MKKALRAMGTVAGCAALLSACDAVDPPISLAPNASLSALPAPPGLVTVPTPAGNLSFWPFTGVDFSGAPQDPLNLGFIGRTDPRALRAALMFLDGDRTAFGYPDDFPFNCTWKDAVGGNQTTYGAPAGWVGNGVQLECGSYDPLRFHVRLFDLGGYTLGGAHLDLLITGTPDHQVISWELAEQLVAVDFLRSGLLDPTLPALPTGPINPSPFGEIPSIIYNEMPPELRALTGGPLDDVVDPVPIATDGEGTVLNVANAATGVTGIARQVFTIQFDLTIPKPFCASGPFDFVAVKGPIYLRQQVNLTPAGNLVSQFHAQGMLTLAPIDLATGEPGSETYLAHVNEHHKNIVTDNVTLVSQFVLQAEIPPVGPFRGRLSTTLSVGPGHADHDALTIRCAL